MSGFFVGCSFMRSRRVLRKIAWRRASVARSDLSPLHVDSPQCASGSAPHRGDECGAHRESDILPRAVQQLVNQLKRLGIEASPEDPRTQRLLDEVKAREARGYAFEAADASLELLARGMLGSMPDFFHVESYQIKVERQIVFPGVAYSASQAVVKIRIGDERLISAAEGDGPVNALDLALRKDLGVYQKHIENLELLDYRVRVFRGGAATVMRVLIEFGDRQGNTWWTVGASGNILDASFQALVDTINYRLFKLGAPGDQGSRSHSKGSPKPRPRNGGENLATLMCRSECPHGVDLGWIVV